MNIQQNIIVFSVHQVNESASVNNANNSLALNALNNMPYLCVSGHYKGHNEESYLVQGLEHLDSVLKLCRRYNQESVLISYGDRSSFLLDVKSGRETYIGKLVNVSLRDILARQYDSYSFNPYTNLYYSCVK